MPIFSYKALDKNSAEISGTLEVDDEKAVLSHLKGMGCHATEIKNLDFEKKVKKHLMEEHKEKQKEIKAKVTGVVFSIIVVLLFGGYLKCQMAPPKPKAPQTREERIKSQFSGWDGSRYGLTKLIKESMNNPKSYENAETRYIDKGDFLIVSTRFRGTNIFGGVVENWIMAKVDLDGNVIEVIAQGP